MPGRPAPTHEHLTTLATHLTGKKGQGAPSAELIQLIASISLACKVIAGKVRCARLEDVLGDAGDVNVQGEAQQKLDVLSNDLMLRYLSRCPHVGICASEEEDHAVVVRPPEDGGRFGVLFDPLDGSSNLDVAAGVGTIFSILRLAETGSDAILQAGVRQLAAGYVLYGSSTLMVLSSGDGVDMFVLDPSLGEFVLVLERLQIPTAKKIYSINEAYWETFSDGLQDYLRYAHRNAYASRYIGSMVADVHRTLIKGGVFLYPATKGNPKGKLRLLYEGNPMGFLVEQAGGTAATGEGRILELQPSELHERCPVILGSTAEVEQVTSRL